VSNSDDIRSLQQRIETLTEREAWFRAQSVQEILALKKTIKLLRTELEEQRQRVTARETRIHELNLARQADAALRGELENDLAEYARQLGQQEAMATAAQGRLEQLRRSPSWRVTAPLRSLHKLFRRAAPAAPAAAAAANPSLVYHLATSPFRFFRPGETTLRGWVLPPAGRSISGIRAIVGTRTFAGLTGLAEPEVVRVYGLQPPHDHPGFKIDLTLAAGVHPLRLEVGVDHGEWITFLVVPLRVMPPKAQAL
jgi:hypothetical protein